MEAIARAGYRVVLVHTVNDEGFCSCGRGAKCPERTRGKHPLAASWTKRATDDEQVLRDQAARLTFEPNLGIALGVQSNGRYLVCIDEDDEERMAVLEAEFGELPETLRGQSPKGLRLFFWLTDGTPLDRVKNITGVGGKIGVDMKAAGGQVVVVGRNAGGEYTCFDPSVPAAELPPAWTLAILAAPQLPKTAGTYTPDMLRKDAKTKKRHEAYLETAVTSECRLLACTGEGQRNSATYAAGCRLLPLASGLHLYGSLDYIRREIVKASVASGLSETEGSAAVASAEKWVVDNGIVRGPREVPSDAPRPIQLEPVDESVDLIEDNGSPAKIAENVARMLAIHPRGSPRFNVLKNRAEWPDGKTVTDHDEVQLQGWLVSRPAPQRVRCGIDAVHAGVLAAAEARHFHPVQEYLNGLKWGGIERSLVTYFAAENIPLNQAFSRCFLIGAVARAMVPGCQLDTVLVLEGAQGIRKTTGMRALVGAQWFSSTHIDVKKTPDCYQALDGFWVVELGEYDKYAACSAQAALKDYISSPVDNFRRSYGRNDVSRPRHCAFCGSTNAKMYLTDESGARRVFPMECGVVDIDAIRRDRDQIWAEAKHRYDSGEKWYLNPKMEEEARQATDGRFQIDAWEGILPQLLVNHHAITTAEGLILLGIEKGKIARGDQMRLADVLSRLGWKRKRMALQSDGRKPWYYERP